MQKTAEPIEMQFGMLSWVDPEAKMHLWGVWSTEKHCKAYDLGIRQMGELYKEETHPEMR